MEVVVDKLQSPTDLSYINDATIVGQMKLDDGTSVGGTINFDYQAGTNGTYIGVASHSLSLTKGVYYTMYLTITLIGGAQHTQLIRRKADYDYR